MNDQYDSASSSICGRSRSRRRRRSWASMRSISPTCRSRRTTPSRCSRSTRATAVRRANSRRRGRRLRHDLPLGKPRDLREKPDEALAGLFAQLRRGDYNAITAYVARNETHAALLRRAAFEDPRRVASVATTVGFGPRFLHSTGQLHKGGPDSCVVLQITADDPDDPMIPGMNVGFRTLLAAQALGDWQSLDKRHRRGVRIHLKGDRSNRRCARCRRSSTGFDAAHRELTGSRPHGGRSIATVTPGTDGAANPLRDGLAGGSDLDALQRRLFRRERRPLQAHAAAGDLLDAAARDAADRLRAVGFSRTPVRRRRIPRVLSPAARCSSCPTDQKPERRRCGTTLRERISYIAADFKDTKHFVTLKERLAQNDAELEHGRQPPLLSLHAAAGFSRDRQAAQNAKLDSANNPTAGRASSSRNPSEPTSPPRATLQSAIEAVFPEK